MKRQLAKKLATYSAIGVGTVTFSSTSADAQIIFTDLTGNELVFSSTSPLELDIDGNGTNDFSFGVDTQATASGYYNFFQVDLAGLAPTNQLATDNPGFSRLANLASGDLVSGGQNFVDNAYLQLIYSGSTFLFGNFQDGDSGFAGIQFADENGDTVFGWIALQASGNVAEGDFSAVEISVSGFAFELSGAEIAAGATGVPEPSSLGLLALGGAGVLARRRKRKSA